MREFVKREVEAIKRDRAWERHDWYTLETLVDRMNEYPSLFQRANNVRWSISRGVSTLIEFPHKVKHFLHRGRYGWATPDTWSMDYTLAKQLDGLFTEFLRVNLAGNSDMTDEEWDHTLETIRDGFRAYHEHQDRSWRCGFEGDTLREQIDAENASFNEALEKVQRSLGLMAHHYPSLWW